MCRSGNTRLVELRVRAMRLLPAFFTVSRVPTTGKIVHRLLAEALMGHIVVTAGTRAASIRCSEQTGMKCAGSASHGRLRAHCARGRDRIQDREAAERWLSVRIRWNEFANLAANASLRVACHRRVVFPRHRAAAHEWLVPGDDNFGREWGVGECGYFNAFDMGANRAYRRRPERQLGWW